MGSKLKRPAPNNLAVDVWIKIGGKLSAAVRRHIAAGLREFRAAGRLANRKKRIVAEAQHG